MKIKPEDYQMLEKAINSELAKLTYIHPRKYFIDRRNELGHSRQRLVWDVFHKANAQENFNLSYTLYKYLNDSRIETALIKILTPYLPE